MHVCFTRLSNVQLVTTSECCAARLRRFNAKYKPETNSDKDILGMFSHVTLYSLCWHLALELQHQGWRSEVYDHFMPPMITTMDSGEIGYKFACKMLVIFATSSHICIVLIMNARLYSSNPSKHITCSRIDETTSNLLRHANTCSPTPSTPTSTPLSTFGVGHFRYLVAAWSVCRVWPHVIIEDEELHKIFIMLFLAVEIHLHQTVARDISDMYSIRVLSLHSTCSQSNSDFISHLTAGHLPMSSHSLA